jgi:hypothetical protein
LSLSPVVRIVHGNHIQNSFPYRSEPDSGPPDLSKPLRDVYVAYIIRAIRRMLAELDNVPPRRFEFLFASVRDEIARDLRVLGHSAIGPSAFRSAASNIVLFFVNAAECRRSRGSIWQTSSFDFLSNTCMLPITFSGHLRDGYRCTYRSIQTLETCACLTCRK